MEPTNFRIDHTNVHYFRYPLDVFTNRQKQLKRSHIVFWSSVPHLWVDQYGAEPCQPVFDKFLRAGLAVDAIVARPYNYTLFFPEDSLISIHSMAYYRNMIDLAAGQGIPVLGIWLWGALRDGGRESQFQNCCSSLEKLCRYAGEKQVRLTVGNVPYRQSAMMNTLGEVQALVTTAGCGNLEVALDYGTAWLNGESPAQWMHAFGGRLSLVYLSDARNNGSGYPLSKGCCALKREWAQMREMGFSGIAALWMEQDFCRQDPDLVDLENQQYVDENF